MTFRLAFLIFALTLILPGVIPAQSSDTEFDWDLAGRIAVQSGGRVKPLDTFARELVKTVYGRDRFRNQHPVETYFRWMADGDQWVDEPLVSLAKGDLRDALGLQNHEGNYFSANELRMNSRLMEIARAGHDADQAGEKPTFTQTKAAEALNRVGTLIAVLNHEEPLMAPAADGDHLTTWRGMPHVMSLSEEALARETNGDALSALSLSFAGMYHSVSDDRPDIFNASAAIFLETQVSMLTSNPEVVNRLAWEVRYNYLEPFFWARVVLLLTFVCYLISLKPPLARFKLAGLISMILGGAIYTGGILMRWHIGDRAPWSNMYESLLTIGWTVVLIAVIFELVRRERVFGMAGSLMGALTLGIAAYASLDRGINPLVPALQSYWLTYHVIIILAGYACFALAMIIGHGVLISAIRSRGQMTKSLRRLVWANLKTIQVGSATLILGILLGAVWANVSWGRFWGWDPKETWSLITWFAYIIFLHGRSAGWIEWRGLAIASVAAFPIVIMTYYGVNFYLSGLHSYGAGSSPGIPYEVWVYLILEALFLTWAISALNTIMPRKPKSGGTRSSQTSAEISREPELEEA